MTENEMVGCHHQLNGHEFEQALGVGDGQGSLVCYSPWGHKEQDTTERLYFTLLTLLTKIRLVKSMVFQVVMYRCESWTIKKAEQQRIDAFELWC